MFATVLHNLKGPRNVGQIIRSHVAYGGGPLLFIAHEEPWTFRKSTSRYSRKLESHYDILHIPNDDDLMATDDTDNDPSGTPIAPVLIEHRSYPRGPVPSEEPWSNLVPTSEHICR